MGKQKVIFFKKKFFASLFAFNLKKAIVVFSLSHTMYYKKDFPQPSLKTYSESSNFQVQFIPDVLHIGVDMAYHKETCNQGKSRNR